MTMLAALGREVLGVDSPDFPFAECRYRPDVDFFPTRGADVRPAKEVCEGCLHRTACLEFALAHHSSFGRFGVWGGTAERERVRILKARKGGGGGG